MTTPDTRPERRRTPRVEASQPLTVTLTTGSSVSVAKLKDISTVGLRCNLETPIAEMTRVRLGFQIDDRQQEVEGTVVRCEQGSHDDLSSWDIAVYFTSMSQPVRDTLGHYVTEETGR